MCFSDDLFGIIFVGMFFFFFSDDAIGILFCWMIFE